MSRLGALSIALCVTTGAAAARAQPAPEDVLGEHGCLACHSTDGSAGPGPTFLGLFLRTSEVRTGGAPRRVQVDDDYVRRSILEPDADVVEGFSPGAMPVLGLTEEDVGRVTSALRALPEEVHEELRTIWILAAGALGFLFLHLGLSFHPVRSRLVARLGEGRFAAVYSVIVGAAFAALVAGWMYRDFVPIWQPPPFTRWIPLVVMPFAFFFLLAGYTTKSPSMAGKEDEADAGPRGVVTVTRHPALWGFALWGLAHLSANGDLASMMLFGSIAALALIGMLHIDRRRARSIGARWDRFAAQTSIVPFAAILRGRTRLDARGLLWRALLALAIYAAMLALHEWEFGVSPLPYGLG